MIRNYMNFEQTFNLILMMRIQLTDILKKMEIIK